MNQSASHERIAKLAYQIWEAEGCPEGRCEVHWQEAERRLRAEPIGAAAAQQDFGDTGVASARNASAPMRDTRPTPVLRPPATAQAH